MPIPEKGLRGTRKELRFRKLDENEEPLPYELYLKEVEGTERLNFIIEDTENPGEYIDYQIVPPTSNGTQGPQGSTGPQGATGTGTQGFQGVQGSVGNTGTQGSPGTNGDQGAQGETGSQGAMGDQGFQGPLGNQGDQGVQGPVGNTGAQGDVGPQGIEGAPGVQGAAGAQGDFGPQGDQGTQGDQGATGAQGDTGAQGFQGDTGAQGAQGSGGSLAFFEEARVITAPNDTIPVHAFQPIGTETDIDVVLRGKGTGAILRHVPDDTATGGNKRGVRAVDFQTSRNANTQVASGEKSFIGNGNNNTASGVCSFIGSGEGNSIVGQNSAILGGSSNSINGSSSAIVSGANNTVSVETQGFIGTGGSNTVGRYGGAILSGLNNDNQGYHAFIGNGRNNTITASGGISFSSIGAGGYNNIAENVACANISNGVGAIARNTGEVQAAGGITVGGDAQIGRYVVKGITNNATPLNLTSFQYGDDLNGATPTTTGGVKMIANQVIKITAQVIGCRNTSADTHVSYTIEAIAFRSSGTYGFSYESVTTNFESAGYSALTAQLDFSVAGLGSNGRFTVKVTGHASEEFKWAASIETVELLKD